MEQKLEKIKSILSGLKLSDPGSRFRAARALRLAVVDCQKYIKESAQTDRGCAQRIARELERQLHIFLGSAIDESAIHRLHTRSLAEEHIKHIVMHLDSIIQEEEKERAALIHEWVSSHAVFSELRRIAVQSWPKGTYVLLFCQNSEGAPNLVIRSEKNGRLFTRFRQQEFASDLKIHQNFQMQPLVVGAAVIAPEKLFFSVGDLPQPSTDMDQLKTLLKLSKQMVEAPANEFIASNPILNDLHNLAHRHELPKNSYVLLFQPSNQEHDDILLSVVVKTTGSGKIVSRFWESDFFQKQNLFDALRGQPDVVGAAVIQGKEVIKILGQVPPPSEQQCQLELLLEMAKNAYERPFLSFVKENEVLQSLYSLAHTDSKYRDASVVLFSESEGGGVDVMNFSSDLGNRRTRIALKEFLSPRVVYENLISGSKVIGASVIADEQVYSKPPAMVGQRKDAATKNHSRTIDRRPVVIAAFGRTPLKINLVASPAMLQRLAIFI